MLSQLCVLLFLTCFWPLVAAAADVPKLEAWQLKALDQLSAKYLGSTNLALPARNLDAVHLDRISRALGGQLAEGGLSAVPAEDIAMLALLQTKIQARTPVSGRPAATRVTSAGAAAAPPSPSGTQPKVVSHAGLGKGQEGFRQGVEKLRQLPISERMVITGDITAGVQAIRVPDADNMSTAFGRFRLNLVTRTLPASPGGRFGNGYFFLQLRAAGGPFDSSPVGRPHAFSAFNDVATDRSRFNESLNRGNIYLGKAYFQQEVHLSASRNSSILAQLGVIDFSDFFDMNRFANNEVRQFLNSAFINSAAYKTAIGAPGFIAQYRREVNRNWLRALSLRVGYAISRTDKAFNSPIWNSELELKTQLGGKQGTWRFGGTIGNVADAGSVSAFYLSTDQWLSRTMGIFGRYVVNTRGPGSRVFGPQWQSLSGGFERRFIDAEDHVSAWGIALSQTWGINTSQSLVPERVFETYYRWQLTNNYSLAPDFQLVGGAGGVPGLHVILGLRTSFEF